MAMNYPKVNGNARDFASITLALGILSIVGFKSISWKQTKKRKKFYGNKRFAVARTGGQYDATGSLEMLREEWDAILAYALTKGVGYMDLVFDSITVTQADTGQPTSTTVLSSAAITDVDDSYQDGDEPNMVKIDLDFMGVSENGVLPVTGMKL